MAIPIAPLVVAGANILGNLISKPKQQQADTSYLDRYINRLKGDLAKRETYHTMMRGSMRNIGAQSEQARKLSDYSLSKYGNIGSGIDVQNKLSIQQNTNTAINQASLQATQQQQAENERVRGQIREAEMMRDRMLAQIKQQNEMAQDQWQKGFASSILQSGANIGASILQQAQNVPELTAPSTQKPPKYDVAYDKETGKGYDVQWNEEIGEWQTLQGDQIDMGKITFGKPDKPYEKSFFAWKDGERIFVTQRGDKIYKDGEDLTDQLSDKPQEVDVFGTKFMEGLEKGELTTKQIKMQLLPVLDKLSDADYEAYISMANDYLPEPDNNVLSDWKNYARESWEIPDNVLNKYASAKSIKDLVADKKKMLRIESELEQAVSASQSIPTDSDNTYGLTPFMIGDKEIYPNKLPQYIQNLTDQLDDLRVKFGLQPTKKISKDAMPNPSDIETGKDTLNLFNE